MARINLTQICDNIKNFLENTKQEYLYRKVKHRNIPAEDLDILYSYLSIKLICKLFGGNFAQQVKVFNARVQEKESDKEIDSSKLVKYDPAGIGEHQYADRVRQKVIHSLEGIINQSAATVSHNQYVQAAKALLDIADKTKLDAAEIMTAYETQLLILAEYLVEIFLPELGQKIKEEFRAAGESVIEKIVEATKPDDEQLKIWSEAIDKVVRSFGLKRYELLLAETMATNPQISEAFDFTKDLIENYKTTSEISFADKDTAKLKEFIGKREQ